MKIIQYPSGGSTSASSVGSAINGSANQPVIADDDRFAITKTSAGGILGWFSALQIKNWILTFAASRLGYRTTNFTAEVGGRYSVFSAGTVIITDPTSPAPVAGDSYLVAVSGGLVRFGAGPQTYSASRFDLRRYFDGTTWFTPASVISDSLTVGGNTWNGSTISGAQNFSSTTRPTSSGTGAPAANSLVMLSDTDARYGSLSVLNISTDLALKDIFATGGTTSGTVGDLRWILSGSGGSVTYLGQSSGSLGLLNSNAISSSLSCAAIFMNPQGYTGAGFFSFSATRTFQMISQASSGLSATRNRSFSFCFVAQPSGNNPAPQSVTPPNSIGIRYIMPSQGAWASTTYAVGANVRPTTANGLKYICTTSGTSGATQPTWPTTIGATVVDGTVTWTCAGADGNASHLLQFFVAGADPLVNITTALSTVAMPSSNGQFLTLSIRTTSTGVFFSVNGETEVFIATTTAISGTPAFITRNDNSATFSNSVVPIRYFGFYAPSKI